ncbi:uncharacterized protein LOC133876649 [Alnus glutinosa]|uniref:uncharacterized protein LOC133876649 n=1 Tax=Alnus glutinosa TaxID=3517 RepID=UPI002D78F1E3|nr:uncharacterized protein LOC133876649 [Alnus glutinosa]
MQECIHFGATICLIQIVKQVEKGSQILKCFMACPQRGDIVCYARCIERHLPSSDVVHMQNYDQFKVQLEASQSTFRCVTPKGLAKWLDRGLLGDNPHEVLDRILMVLHTSWGQPLG